MVVGNDIDIIAGKYAEKYLEQGLNLLLMFVALKLLQIAKQQCNKKRKKHNADKTEGQNPRITLRSISILIVFARFDS